MTKPMLLAEFTRLPPASRACPLDGLSAAIDMVAEVAPPAHRFLRFQYHATALARHGGAARTMLVEHDGDAVIALPLVRTGPAAARLVTPLGVDTPFRAFPAAIDAPESAFDTLVDALAGECQGLRSGPVADDDPGFAALRAAALRQGWRPFDLGRRPVTVADLAPGEGVEIDGAGLVAGGFGKLAALGGGPALAFWRAAAADSVLAAMLSARVMPGPAHAAAFALYLDVGGVRRVVASGGDPRLLEPRRAATTRDWLMVRPGLPALLVRALGAWWQRRSIDPSVPASL